MATDDYDNDVNDNRPRRQRSTTHRNLSPKKDLGGKLCILWTIPVANATRNEQSTKDVEERPSMTVMKKATAKATVT